MSLVEPKDAPQIPGMASPSELYWVLKVPAPLAGMRYPRPDVPWANLAAAGFRCVVSLHPATYDPNPLVQIFSAHLEDLCHGREPREPAKETRLIAEAAETVVEALRSGEGVVVHRVGGRGRTGSVIGCVLRRLGYDAGEVVPYLDRVHKCRGKDGWPESPWQAALVEKEAVDD